MKTRNARVSMDKQNLAPQPDALQIDLWRGLKLNSTAGSGPRGNSVGLSHEFNY